MSTLTYQNVKGSELPKSFTGLNPEGTYRVFVQPEINRKDLAQRLKSALRAQQPDPDMTDKADDEIMDLVNAVIEEERARQQADGK